MTSHLSADLSLVDENAVLKPTITAEDQKMGECVICKVKTPKRCRGCCSSDSPSDGLDVFYCGKEHQKEDWPKHKRICIRVQNKNLGAKKVEDPKLRRPVDELVDCIINDFLPATTSSCYKVFGFSKCQNEREESNLLGIYVGLFKLLKVDIDTIDEASRNGQLFELIRKEYEAYGSAHYGQYYPWLLKNPHILQ